MSFYTFLFFVSRLTRTLRALMAWWNNSIRVKIINGSSLIWLWLIWRRNIIEILRRGCLPGIFITPEHFPTRDHRPGKEIRATTCSNNASAADVKQHAPNTELKNYQNILL